MVSADRTATLRNQHIEEQPLAEATEVEAQPEATDQKEEK